MAHADFKLLRTQLIESLSVTVEEYEHTKTGAKHYHMAADNDENVFLVALRTMPNDSTGVAHILEHTALCGSRNYPVRDPFFMMIRRSLNTFMNAFTSSDWTAYPFASKNKKDFNNLLSVYLDAVFFASLNEQDFLQEGHRLEFQDPADPATPLQFKGVVFNEMKGAMSSVTSQLWQAFTKYLYPTTTYHFNSGGEPEDILKLTYEQLTSFYKEHYHPSNAIFMTYGDISATEHHEKFAEYLNQFERQDKRISVADEQRYYAPIRVEESYASQKAEQQTHHVIGWLLGHGANLEEQLEAHFLSSLLLENSASPLREALEKTKLGESPSPLCGLEDSNKEMCFVCGVEGSEPDNRQAVEDLVLKTLSDVAEAGVSQDQIESVLHQLELSQREVGGDGYPYGLQLILSSLAAATHYSDPVDLLNLDPELEKLREKAKDTQFVSNLIHKYLLDNPHRVTLTFKPDSEIDQRKLNAEQSKLDKIRDALSEQEIQNIVSQGTALKERQLSKDDESILPKVGLEDVADKLSIPQPTGTLERQGEQVTTYSQGTNGLTYHQIIKALPELSEEELYMLPLVTHYLAEVGVAGESYEATQNRQSLHVGGISAFTTIRQPVDDKGDLISYWTLSGKALARNSKPFYQLLRDTAVSANFKDHGRIKDLLKQSLSRKEQSINGQGHSLAMGIAASGTSGLSQLAYSMSGLPSLLRAREWVKQIDNTDFLNKFCDQLQTLYEKISRSPSIHLLVSDNEGVSAAIKAFDNEWVGQSKSDRVPSFNVADFSKQVKEAWLIPSQTNFCAMALPTVSLSHADAPALTVLANVLKNGFLHTAIREQGGAYGGGAVHDGASGVFKFYSYRDPRIEGTLSDFKRSIDWFANTKHTDEAIEQAILGVVSGIDKPGSPAGEAKQAFHNALQGRNDEWRNDFRNRILSVTLEDLFRVVDAYFDFDRASYGVVAQASAKEELVKLGFDIHEI